MTAEALRPEPGGHGRVHGFRDVRRVEVVPISALTVSGSPRSGGIDMAHVRALAGTDAPLPPILVHRPGNRVVDGMHRLRAAVLRGRREIEVCFFDGSEADAFIAGVQANVTHGLPLSLAEREAAAVQIISLRPQLSDRAIAMASGLSARTVKHLRSRSTAGIPQSHERVGRDGRIRPLDAAAGRRRAYECLQARPEASLREIAREAGIAIGTARDVRARVQRGENPLPPKLRGRTGFATEEPLRPAPVAPRPLAPDSSAALRVLKKDPALRFSERGRELVRWLVAQAAVPADLPAMLDCVPPHCVEAVAAVAAAHARRWQDVAEQLRRR
ncbi:streptomycin biosynthesis protein [Amycolatopsis sp. NPDC051102]|uniref:ParB/RepB/Spo0J family partition protein n=1 Tax=Amycolatopsis sp. NPDC051102 TaxID=3155163 RepID=UPI00341F8341